MVFAVTGSVFYSSQANYVVILTVEISSTCVNSVEHQKLGVLIATYFPPFYLDVSVSSICLVCVYGARSPGLQRTGKLRACGQNAVYSISGPAAREKNERLQFPLPSGDHDITEVPSSKILLPRVTSTLADCHREEPTRWQGQSSVRMQLMKGS